MSLKISKSDPIPGETLARLVNGELKTVRMDHFVAGKRTAIVGVPGSFTPVCTNEHLPSFIRRAPSLKASGFDQLICVATNDPWVVDEWARKLDPDGHVTFLADGNLDFTRALGMQSMDRKHFLGWRSRRYLIICDDGIIKSIKVEASIHLVSCTAAADVVLIEA